MSFRHCLSSSSDQSAPVPTAAWRTPTSDAVLRRQSRTSIRQRMASVISAHWPPAAPRLTRPHMHNGCSLAMWMIVIGAVSSSPSCQTVVFREFSSPDRFTVSRIPMLRSLLAADLHFFPSGQPPRRRPVLARQDLLGAGVEPYFSVALDHSASFSCSAGCRSRQVTSLKPCWVAMKWRSCTPVSHTSAPSACLRRWHRLSRAGLVVRVAQQPLLGRYWRDLLWIHDAFFMLVMISGPISLLSPPSASPCWTLSGAYPKWHSPVLQRSLFHL